MSTSTNIYCFKCRKAAPFKDPKAVIMKNGKNATSATCGTCNGKVFRIEKSTLAAPPVAAAAAR